MSKCLEILGGIVLALLAVPFIVMVLAIFWGALLSMIGAAFG